MSILACSGFEEGPGANFTPPTLGNFMEKQKLESKRLREARAGMLVAREGRQFHEKQAQRFGINTNRGLAHFRASKMYTREGNRLQEMFDQGGQLGELPPKAIMKANKAAMQFHKKSAEKAGLDSDLGHAHVAAMEHHADIFKKAKDQHKKSKMQQQPEEAKFGYGSKKSPVPVPKKSEQPSEDIQDPNKPPVKLRPQDANKESAEGGPGSGPRDKHKAWKKKQLEKAEVRGKKIAAHKKTASEMRRHIGNYKKESGRGPDYSMSNTFPSKTSKQAKDELVFRGKKQKMFDPRRNRDEGVKRSKESRQDDDAPRQIDLREFYKPAERTNGWKNSNVFSPTRLRESQQTSGVVIKEF